MLSAIILAAGLGKRLKLSVSKPLVKIGKLPVLSYSLQSLNSHPDIDEIIIVASKVNQKAVVEIVKNYSFKKIKAIVLGGQRRQDSVYNGLNKISLNSKWVLIHDSARPFIEKKLITQVIRQAKKTGAAILGVPVKATIKSIKNNFIVDKTLKRANLWEIQTPQVFRKEFIFKAYKKYSKSNVTDDASLVEKLNKKIRIVTGSYRNIKITTPEDLLFARAILKRNY